MKGITIIVILSVVWSIIASIIEKKKAAAKKITSVEEQPTVKTALKVDPVKVKIESLRRRGLKPSIPPTIEKQVNPLPNRSKSLKPISPLHTEDCPITPTIQPVRKNSIPANQLAKMLKNRRNIRTAIVLSEILSKPVSLRN
jgi:hypothetical protein